MFEQLISMQARARPEAVAVRIGEACFTYAMMDADIRRCASKLKAHVAPGDRVALALANPYLHWILAFACEALGATTITLPEPPRTEAAARFVGARLLITDASPTPESSLATVVIDRAWTEALRRLHPGPLPSRTRSGDDPVFIVLSSGTTGTPKKVLLTRDMLDQRLQQGRSTDDFARARARIEGAAGGVDVERRLSPIPLASIATMMLSLLGWELGGSTCVREPHVSWSEALVAMRVTMFACAPSHLQAICDELPRDARAIPGLQLVVVGGVLPKALSQDVRRRLTPDISIAYGTTETSYITTGHIDMLQGVEDSAGYVDPGIEVEIVGADGAESPSGEIGEIRVRGPTVVSGYLEHEGDARAYFRNGWYHPGDLGTIDGDGVVRVLGRADDLMNIAGAKVLPSRIEAAVLGDHRISEAAAFHVVEAGQARLCVAVAAPSDVDVAGIRARVAGEDPAFAHDLRVFRIERLPRNGLGKVERLTLRASAAAGELQLA